MNRRISRAALGAAALAALALVTMAGAAPPGEAPGKSKHEQVVEYWTPDRVARAIPREYMLDVHGTRPTPLKRPGGGGGGGDSGGGTTTSAVTGAEWTGGGLIGAATGKVLFTMVGVDYVCSGTVVVDTSSTTAMVLTAGHCAFDETSGTFATNWLFAPGYSDGGSIVTNPDGSHTFTCDTTPYGCWTKTALVTTTAWANGSGSLAAFNDDYAFAVVGPGGKSGEAVQLDQRVTPLEIAFNRTHPTTVYAFGYPHAAPYDGQKLIYCAGTDVADGWGGTSDFGLNCDQTGGSSGGSWLVDFDEATGSGQVNSVNSFKYVRGPWSKYMFGPYFDDYTAKTYAAAKTATGDKTIAP